MTMRPAPARRSSWARMMPVGPAPNMRMESPTRGAMRSTPWTAQAVGSVKVASSKDSLSLRANTLSWLMSTYSAKPPGMLQPWELKFSQYRGLSLRHGSQ